MLQQTLSHNVVSSTPRYERGSNKIELTAFSGGSRALIAQLVVNSTTIRSRP